MHTTNISGGMGTTFGHPESLGDEIAHGRLLTTGRNGAVTKSFDMLTAFLDVLGKPVSAVSLEPAKQRIPWGRSGCRMTPLLTDWLASKLSARANIE